MNNSCVNIKTSVSVFHVLVWTEGFRVTPVIESLVVGVCHAQVLSIIC